MKCFNLDYFRIIHNKDYFVFLLKSVLVKIFEFLMYPNINLIFILFEYFELN